MLALRRFACQVPLASRETTLPTANQSMPGSHNPATIGHLATGLRLWSGNIRHGVACYKLLAPLEMSNNPIQPRSNIQIRCHLGTRGDGTHHHFPITCIRAPGYKPGCSLQRQYATSPSGSGFITCGARTSSQSRGHACAGGKVGVEALSAFHMRAFDSFTSCPLRSPGRLQSGRFRRGRSPVPIPRHHVHRAGDGMQAHQRSHGDDGR